ncbi:hypothetical protein T484DRAFT_3100274 [Baffinella frigidus]|nr:hypothetical protein T484DRAFT_3100274 [Cryptophyta sp. CCMP2293]
MRHDAWPSAPPCERTRFNPRLYTPNPPTQDSTRQTPQLRLYTPNSQLDSTPQTPKLNPSVYTPNPREPYTPKPPNRLDAARRVAVRAVVRAYKVPPELRVLLLG